MDLFGVFFVALGLTVVFDYISDRWIPFFYLILLSSIGLSLILSTFRTTTFNCQLNRGDPTCIKEIFYFDRHFRTIELQEVGEARVETSCGDSSCTDSVRVKTSAWFDPSIEWSDGRSHREVADQFNLFIAGEGESREFVTESNPGVGVKIFFWILGLVNIGFGIGLTRDMIRRY